MTRGQNSTLNEYLGSLFNVESRPGVTIQQGVQILSVGGVVIQWPPVSGVAIQHEKSVESWSQPVESRPHGSKFNWVKIQSYTGIKRMSMVQCDKLQGDKQETIFSVYNLRRIRPMSSNTFLVKASLH